MQHQYSAGQRVRLIRTGELGTIVTGYAHTGLAFPEDAPRIEVLWDWGVTRWPLLRVIKPASQPMSGGNRPVATTNLANATNLKGENGQ